MKNQLDLTKKELGIIGFKKHKRIYFIETINGCFYYNLDHPNYRWYQKTTIGNASDYIHLSINSKPELFLLLSIFRLKFRYIL